MKPWIEVEMIVKFQNEKFIENSFCKINAKVESRFFCNSIEAITEEVNTVRPLGHLLLSPKVRVLKIQGPYRDR